MDRLIEMATLLLTFTYDLLCIIQKQLDHPDIQVLDTAYADQVALICTLPQSAVSDVTLKLENAICGQIDIQIQSYSS